MVPRVVRISIALRVAGPRLPSSISCSREVNCISSPDPVEPAGLLDESLDIHGREGGFVERFPPGFQRFGQVKADPGGVVGAGLSAGIQAGAWGPFQYHQVL